MPANCSVCVCCPFCLCQASPYVIFLFVVPVHYLTHVSMLFFSGMWATNIHDAVVSTRTAYNYSSCARSF